MSEQSKVDPNFEYDAPNYVDFDLLKQGLDDDGADLWFENHIDTEDRANHFREDQAKVGPSVFGEDKAKGGPSVFGEDKAKVGPSVFGEDKAKVGPSVFGEDQAKVGPSVFGEDQANVIRESKHAPVEVPPDCPVEHPEKDTTQTAGLSSVVEPKDQLNEDDQDPTIDNKPLTAGEMIVRMHNDTKVPRRKLTSRSVPLAIESLLRKPLRPSRKSSSTVVGQRAVSNCKVAMESLTIPQTPEVLRRQEKKRPLSSKTTEELEMEKIEELKREAQMKLKLSKRSFQMLSKPSEPVLLKRIKQTTEPVEFNFKTTERCKPSGSVVDNSITINPSNFPLLLRSGSKEEKTQPSNSTCSSVTIAKPFKFVLDDRLRKDSKGIANNTIIPTAEAVVKFQKQTPPRFRSNPSKNTTQTSGKMAGPGELTVPKTPCLLTKNRSRPITVMSAAEAEEEEIAKLKEYKFRANPINPKVFNKNGLYGVPKRPADQMSTTVPESPHLATKERMDSRKRKIEEEENPGTYEFHAQPILKGILEGVKGVPERAPPPLTCAASPAFMLKRRKLGESRPTTSEESRPVPVIKANPMPDFSKVFAPIISHKTTEVVPFTFEERYQSKPSLVQQILEKDKENRPFKANPLPSFSTPSLPPKVTKQITQPQPFKLEAELRGQQFWAKFQEELRAKQKQAKAEAEFVASDCKVLEQEPFVPCKSSKPLTEISNFVLYTEIQSEQRKRFDEERQLREEMMKQEEMEKRTLKEAADAVALQEYRHSLVHKAQPIHHYAPVEIHPSDRPITAPISPELRTSTRLRTITTHD